MESQNNITEQMKEAARNAESKAFAGMENVWDKVAARLDADEETKPAAVPFINYKKMAAAAAVLILIGLGAGYLLFNNKAEHTIAGNDVKPTGHIEAPEKPVVTASQPNVVKEPVTIPKNIKSTAGYTVASNNGPKDAMDAIANEQNGVPVAEATSVIAETQAAPALAVNDGVAVVKGKVTDPSNEGIPGATIKIVGTTKGTMTDVDGNFEIEMPADKKKISVDALGFSSQTLEASNSMAINLSQGNNILSDVTVTQPYGPPVIKQSYTGAADVITSKQIEKVPAANNFKELGISNENMHQLGYNTSATSSYNAVSYNNNTGLKYITDSHKIVSKDASVAINNTPVSDITKAMEGAAPGVQVKNSGGAPGSSSSVKLRGIASLDSTARPLFIVDGTPYDGDIMAIDPNDIESITILKDATTAALYGSRSAGNIVVIKTKPLSKSNAKKWSLKRLFKKHKPILQVDSSSHE